MSADDVRVPVAAGLLESDGGRPSVSLRVAPRFALVAGVDVGETRVRVELFDLAMAQLASADYPSTRRNRTRRPWYATSSPG